MSFTFGFYNSINKDRRYDAIQVSQIFDGVISDGVYPTYGARFHVDKYSSNVIRIDSGRAWFDHTWNLNDGPEYKEALPSDQYANRYDAIVIEVNSNPEVRRNELKWVRGPSTSGGTPEFPVMADTEYIHQYPLAYVYRPAGTNVIPDDGGVINNAGNPTCPWAMIYKSMVEIDPGEGDGGAPSELEQHIIYNNDTLDFKASTLMQNGKPLVFNDEIGEIEEVVLYNSGSGTTGAELGATLPLTLSSPNQKYLFLVIQCNANTMGGHAVNHYFDSAVIPHMSYILLPDPATGDGISFSSGQIFKLNIRAANTNYGDISYNGKKYSGGTGAFGITLAIKNKVLDLIDTDSATNAFYNLILASDSWSNPQNSGTFGTNYGINYYEYENGNFSMISYDKTTAYNSMRINKVVGYRKKGS